MRLWDLSASPPERSSASRSPSLMKVWQMPVPEGSREVPGLQAVELAVDPGVDLPLDDVDELLLRRLGVRIGGARARRHPVQEDPDPEQPGGAAEVTRRGHLLLAVRVAVALLGTISATALLTSHAFVRSHSDDRLDDWYGLTLRLML